jgi:hypothetical protein
MSMKKLMEALYVLFRANVPALIEGVHGIGKSSIVYAIWLMIARDKGDLDDDAGSEHVTSLNAGAYFDSLEYRKDRFWIWSFSAANIMVDELIGYADKHRPWLDADNLAWQAASNVAKSPEEVVQAYRVIQPAIMAERGITDGNQDTVILRYLRSTKFLPPADHEGGGIFFPDELNLSLPPTEKALMSYVLEGRFLDLTRPPGVWCVSSQNPPTAGYHARELNPATLDRFCRMAAKTKLSETIELFAKMNLHEAVQDALIKHGDEIHNLHEAEIEFEIHVDSNNRGKQFASQILNVITPKEMDSVGMSLLRGVLGDTPGAAVFREAKAYKDYSLNLDEIINGYGVDMDTWDSDKTGYADVDMTPVRHKVMKIARKAATMRVDIINSVLRQALKWMIELDERVIKKHGDSFDAEKYEHEPGDLKHCLNFMVFLTDISSEMGRAFLTTDVQSAQCFAGSLFGVAKTKLGSDLNDHINKKAEEHEAEFSQSAA